MEQESASSQKHLISQLLPSSPFHHPTCSQCKLTFQINTPAHDPIHYTMVSIYSYKMRHRKTYWPLPTTNAVPESFSWFPLLQHGTCPSLRPDLQQKLSHQDPLPSPAPAHAHHAHQIHLCSEAILQHHLFQAHCKISMLVSYSRSL